MAAEVVLRHGMTEIVDIGCGAQELRTVLPPSVSYQGVDIERRDANTIVHDLDAAPLPMFGKRWATMLGVVGYLANLDRVLQSDLKQFEMVVISYNHWTLLETLRTPLLKAGRRTWQNRLGLRAFRRKVRGYGWRIIEQHRVRHSEVLLLIERSEA
jgi:hypothetical protein